VILDPGLTIAQSARLNKLIRFDRRALEYIHKNASELVSTGNDPIDALVTNFLFGLGPDAIAEALWITRPEVAITRLPKMQPLCAPWPHLAIDSWGKKSTAGVFCRDTSEVLGVTACFHGTGPIGTAVDVGSQNSSVALASNVQDTVFVPLTEGYIVPHVRGTRGVLSTRTPGQYDNVTFFGSSSGETATRIISYDAGLLRSRPTVQLRVQTLPNTNAGDSGAALINQDDQVIGFAFERSEFGEIPEMTDWIWAANALSALNLRAI
jgi:hypothetical protein